jgi:8-oxo-dGTP diphosphatase
METDKTKYLEIEAKIFKILKTQLGERLHLYCLTGSLARGNPVPGWSDIDIVLVVDAYTPDFFKLLESVSRIDGIKIGITFYSLEEFNDRYFRDPKTHAALELIEKGVYVPKVLSDSVDLTSVSITQKIFIDAVEFSNMLHMAKRSLLVEKGDVHDSIKKVIVLIRIILKQYNIWPVTSEEVFVEMAKKFKDFPVIDKPVNVIYYDDWKEKGILIFEWIRKNTTNIFPLMNAAKTMIDRVRAVIISDQRVLVIERQKPDKPVYFVFPGGGVERTDAGAEEALKRECREELGLEVKVGEEICRVEFGGQIEAFYRCEISSGEVTQKIGGPEAERATTASGTYKIVWKSFAEAAGLNIQPRDVRDRLPK